MADVKSPWLSHMTELVTCVFDLGKQGIFRRHVRAVTIKALSLFFDVDRHVSDLLQNVLQNPASIARCVRMLQVRCCVCDCVCDCVCGCVCDCVYA